MTSPVSHEKARGCRFTDLRISRAFWVSPPTGVDTDGVLIRNVSSIRCELHGPVRAVVTDPGYPDLRARGFIVGVGPDSTVVVLAPGRSTELVVADSHSCAKLPTRRYHHLAFTVAGHNAYVLLPDRSSSTAPDFNDRRLSLAIDDHCGPLISGFLPVTAAAPPGVW